MPCRLKNLPKCDYPETPFIKSLKTGFLVYSRLVRKVLLICFTRQYHDQGCLFKDRSPNIFPGSSSIPTQPGSSSAASPTTSARATSSASFPNTEKSFTSTSSATSRPARAKVSPSSATRTRGAQSWRSTTSMGPR